MRTARLAASTKAARTRAISSSVMARGICQPGPNGNRRGRNRRPRIFASRQRLAAFPRPLRRSLATGVGKLNGELGAADAPAMGHDPLQRRLAGVGIEAEAAMGNTAEALDMGRFDDDQPGAGIRQHAEVGHVPIGSNAVVGAVLAHRRNHDAVREIEIRQPQRRKQSTRHDDQIARTARFRKEAGPVPLP